MENIDLREITRDIGDIIRNKIKDVIIRIAIDHCLDEEEALQNYLPSIEENTEPSKKKRKRKKFPPDECCMGRKQFGEQCTRRKKDGSEFCGSHMKNLPYGKIGDNREYLCKVKGKRGRKKKKDSVFANNEDYVETWIDDSLGSDYLIDKDGNVYSNNQISPKIVGRKNDQTGMIEPISLDILEHYK